MFEEIEIPFEVMVANTDEVIGHNEGPVDFAMRAALEKGEAVAQRLSVENRFNWIVAADTVVIIGDELLCKPGDSLDARRMLGRLSGQTHTVVTGWVVGKHKGPWISEHAKTQVTFHELTDSQMDGYVETAEGMDKAGAYAIQGIGAFLVERIEGNYLNVVGLPLSHVVRALLKVGALPRFPL
jgi:nucleoside triphosphate pyrophosphatase